MWQISNEDVTERLYSDAQGKDATQICALLRESDRQHNLHVLRNRIGFIQYWATLGGGWDWQKLDYDWLRAFCPRLAIMQKAFLDIWIFCGKAELGYLNSLLAIMEQLTDTITSADQQRTEQIAAEKAALTVFQPQPAPAPTPLPPVIQPPAPQPGPSSGPPTAPSQGPASTPVPAATTPAPQPGPSSGPQQAPSQGPASTPAPAASMAAPQAQWSLAQLSPEANQQPFNGLSHAQALELIDVWLARDEKISIETDSDMTVLSEKYQDAADRMAKRLDKFRKKTLEIIRWRSAYMREYLQRPTIPASDRAAKLEVAKPIHERFSGVATRMGAVTHHLLNEAVLAMMEFSQLK